MSDNPLAYVVLQRRAAELVVSTQFGSAGQLQRQLGVSRMVSLALLLDLEEQGFIGKIPELGKARDVILPFPGVEKLRELIDACFPLPAGAARREPCRDCSDLNLQPCAERCPR